MSVGERNDIEGARQLAIRCANEKPLGPVFPLAVPTPFHRILYPKKLRTATQVLLGKLVLNQGTYVFPGFCE